MEAIGIVAAVAALFTVIEPFGESTVFFVDAGEGEVEGLGYEGTIEPV